MMDISVERVTIRLVEGAPQCTVFLQGLYSFADILFKLWDRFFLFPSACLIEPQRVRKVMQRDHWSHPAFTQSAQHSAVAVQRVFVPGIRRGLDAAPFDGHAVRVLSSLCSAVEVLFPAASPPIGCQTRRSLRMTALFPHPPLIVRVVAFHLVRGGRRPP